MGTTPTTDILAVDGDFIERFCAGNISEEEFRRFAQQSPELVAFTLLELQRRIAGNPSAGANQPSSTIPPYAKPNTGGKPGKGSKKKKRGAQKGHPGSSRPAPPQPDRTRHQKFDACPDCGGKLKDTGDTRERITEDLPEDLKPVITKDVIHRDWCPCCKKRVEPKPPDVLPRCQIGNRALVFSAMLHYLQGLTISQIVETLNFHLTFKITDGGLVQMWQRLGKILYQWYQEIHQQSLEGSKLYADETGWRVQGQTHWLWCFTSDATVYYMVDRSRGSPALQKFFTRYFDGTLITDFWSPYAAIDCADKQKCWPHLLRDMAKVDQDNPDDREWASFSRRVVSVFRDAKKTHDARADIAELEYDERVVRLEGRLADVATQTWEHADARRLAKRLNKHGNELLTFMWYDDVASDNNTAERAIRPAVMIRKMSYANQSEQGATTQAVLMSVFRTLKLRKLHPINTILNALADYNRTGVLPNMPNAGSGN